MFQIISMEAQQALFRVVPTLLAMQDAKAPGGGAAAPASGGGGGGSPLMSLLLPVLMIGFFYFVIIRPANKQRKEQEGLLKSLKKGDKVVTNSGIIGTITGVEDPYMTLEISQNVRVKFLREAVTKKVTEEATKSDDKNKSKEKDKPSDLFAKGKL